jgi:hypothetical protein
MLLTLFAFQIVLTPKRMHHIEFTTLALSLQKFPRTVMGFANDAWNHSCECPFQSRVVSVDVVKNPDLTVFQHNRSAINDEDRNA